MSTSGASGFQTNGQSIGDMQLDTNVFRQPGQAQTQEEHQQRPVTLKTAKHDTCYYMQHDSRGKAVIINFSSFKKDVKEREGSEMDVENLRKAFSHLKFEVMEWNKENNLTVERLKQKLNDLAIENHANSDCLVIVAMTHGNNSDELWAIDEKFHTKDLWKPFTAGNCTTLAGKPKLFFIQACRGDNFEKYVYLKNAMETNDDGLYPIPIHSDMLLVHSTFQGYVAVRKPEIWFIKALCEELLQNGTKHSLLNLLTSVNRRVAVGCAFTCENLIVKQQPVIVSTLTRKLYFGEKEGNS